MNNMIKALPSKETGEKGEKSNDGSETLAAMAKDFNPDRAKKLVERDRPKDDKKYNDGTLLSTKPQKVEKQKPVGELTPQEASEEYLKLLKDLSSNFTSAESITGREGSHYDKNGNIVNGSFKLNEYKIQHGAVHQLYKTATWNNYYKESQPETTTDDIMKREGAIDIADRIIMAQSDWQAAGESTTLEKETAEKASIKADRAKLEKIRRGPFGKVKETLYGFFRPKEYKRIHNQWQFNVNGRTKAEHLARAADVKLKTSLAQAYQTEPHTETSINQSKLNEDFNNKFFSKERQEKIDRAIELRRKLESDKLLKRYEWKDQQSSDPTYGRGDI